MATLSQARFSQAHRDLSQSARKVYEAIPVAEHWTFQQVYAEVRRLGINMRMEIAMGCVKALKEAGLVREERAGAFIRTPVRDAIQQAIQQAQATNPNTESPPPMTTAKPAAGDDKPRPIDQLATLAGRLRVMGDEALSLHHRCVQMADDLENIAIEVEDTINDPKIAKLRTLAAALKEL